MFILLERSEDEKDMALPLIYIVFLVAAIGIAVVAEVLVAYQKYQMKKQFTDELNQRENEKTSSKDHEVPK